MSWLAQRFELARHGSASAILPMEGLRGFAVLLVFLVHYVTGAMPWIPRPSRLAAFAVGLHALGNCGVDLFFVMSGYLIYGSLMAREAPFLQFMARRIERIYPVFLVVIAIYLALSFVFPGESKIPEDPFAAVVYLAANLLLLPGILPIQPMITVAWSLSYEMAYYLAIPLLIASLRLRQRSPAWRMAFFVAAAAGIVIVGGAYGAHLRLVMFISGILLYETRRQSWSFGSAAGATALVLGLLAKVAPLHGALEVLVLFAAFFVTCHACFAGVGWLPRAFSWRPLRWLGNMSYSYYLIHGLTLKAAFLVVAMLMPTAGGAVLFWGMLPVMLAATLFVSSMLFLAVERPFSLEPRRMRTLEPAVPGAPLRGA